MIGTTIEELNQELKAICEIAGGGWKVLRDIEISRCFICIPNDGYFMIGSEGFKITALPLLLVAACDALSGREWPDLSSSQGIKSVIFTRRDDGEFDWRITTVDDWNVRYKEKYMIGTAITPMDARLAALRAYLKAQAEEK